MKKLAVSLVCCAAIVMAAESDFKTHTEFSYIHTKGNTDTKSLGLDFKGEKRIEPHRFVLDADAFYAEDNGEETKNYILVEGNYFYRLSDRTELNYLIGYKDDKFGGYDYQFYTGPGLYHRLFEDETQTLFIGANLLYAIDEYENGENEDYFSGRADMDYEYRFNENVKFVEEADYHVRFDDTDTWFFNSKSSIYSKMSDALSLGISYKINYQNNPPADKKKTDTALLVSLVVDW
jgi:putative salt-induced outer membrane protein